jgi:hypothetical protein
MSNETTNLVTETSIHCCFLGGEVVTDAAGATSLAGHTEVEVEMSDVFAFHAQSPDTLVDVTTADGRKIVVRLGDLHSFARD